MSDKKYDMEFFLNLDPGMPESELVMLIRNWNSDIVETLSPEEAQLRAINACNYERQMDGLGADLRTGRITRAEYSVKAVELSERYS